MCVCSNPLINTVVSPILSCNLDKATVHFHGLFSYEFKTLPVPFVSPVPQKKVRRERMPPLRRKEARADGRRHVFGVTGAELKQNAGCLIASRHISLGTKQMPLRHTSFVVGHCAQTTTPTPG